MACVISGNTNLETILIGEKSTALIKEDQDTTLRAVSLPKSAKYICSNQTTNSK